VWPIVRGLGNRVALPAHEKAKVIISDLVKILLDELDMRGSLWVRPPSAARNGLALSPMIGFYIQHHAAMVGKNAWTCASIPHQIWY